MAMNKRAGEPGVAESVHELVKAAEIFETCAGNIQKLTDNITPPCTTPNAGETIHQRLVQAKITGFKQLVKFYNAAASDCRAEVIKLKNGALPEDVLPTLSAGFQFFGKQLQVETTHMQNILTVISNNHFDQPNQNTA